MAFQPGEIARLRRGGRDDEEARFALARDRQVGLDAAALIEPLRVDDLADGNRDVVGANPVEHGLGVRAFEHELGKRRLVEQADALAHRAMLRAEYSNQFWRP